MSAAEAATRQVPLKRQCTRQFTDKRRAAGLPAHSATRRSVTRVAKREGPRGNVVLDESRVRGSSPQVYPRGPDRKSTRLNSSHVRISYAVFCFKKKNSA